MFKKSLIIAAASAAMVAGGAQAAAARDYISIVGSSTVYPFATVVAEQFGKSTKFKTPKIESTGSGGGIKLFCAGVGVEHPDITNASRAIKASELEQCAANGVKEVVEVKIGYDGISVGHAKSAADVGFTRQELFLALAKDVPDPKGGDKLVANPYKTWKDINAKLPEEVAISILAEIISFMRSEEEASAVEAGNEEVEENDKIFINPVCNVPVEKSTAKHVIEYEGMNYYFCCDGCKVSFEKEPEKYALKPENAH